MTAQRVIFVKLGGSLITDKSGHEVVRGDVLTRLASELRELEASFDGAVVLGHGSGSFGHAAATASDWPEPPRAPSPAAVSATQDAAGRLHREVLAALLGGGLRPFSLAPGSFMMSARGRVEDLLVDPLLRALRGGLLPVLMGDVVLDSEHRAEIFSTERVFLSVIPPLMARGVEVDGVYWLGNTDGVLDASGATVPRISKENARQVVDSLTGDASLASAPGAPVADVTGGMRHRLESALELCRLGIASCILNGAAPGALARAVAGEALPATRVESAELAAG